MRKTKKTSPFTNNRINPSEAITFFKKNRLISGCFVTAVHDEVGFPMPAIIVDPLNDDLTNFVLMIDGDGMVNRNLMHLIEDIVNGKKVRMRYS
jgi:hypothetical protein